VFIGASGPPPLAFAHMANDDMRRFLQCEACLTAMRAVLEADNLWSPVQYAHPFLFIVASALPPLAFARTANHSIRQFLQCEAHLTAMHVVRRRRCSS